MPSGLPGSKFFGNKKKPPQPRLLRLSAAGGWCGVQNRSRDQEQEACCREGTNISVTQTHPRSAGEPCAGGADDHLMGVPPFL